MSNPLERFNPFSNKRRQLDALIDSQEEQDALHRAVRGAGRDTGPEESGKTGSSGARQASRMVSSAWRSSADKPRKTPSKAKGTSKTISKLPEDMFIQCPSCEHTLTRSAMRKQLMVCPSCGYHLPLSAPDRLASILDEGNYRELDHDLVGDDPLDFPGYEEKLEGLRKKTGLKEAVVTATGSIGGHKVVIAVLDSRFLMGSMGVAVGEKVTRAVEYATESRLPLVIFSASGGARMQEGILSLMQMAKTSAAIARHDAAGLLYISVMTHPTTGGVTASFASLGDVILSEPGALIGFAGPRVIRQTINQELPKGFQRADAVKKCGFLDAIVNRGDLRDVIIRLIETSERPTGTALLNLGLKGTWKKGAPAGADQSAAPATDAMPANSADSAPATDAGPDASSEAAPATGAAPDASSAAAPEAGAASAEEPAAEEEHLTAADHVRLARSQERPDVLDYIDALCEGFVELHGDRLCGDDHSIVGGVATFRGVPVTIIGHKKGHDVQSNIDCNFGMANPEGYRKAQRLAREAEKFGRPIITIIDTPGAYPGVEAEERGQGEAIARSIELFSQLKVPVIAVLIGEGGSGGALALAVADAVIMLENAIYSVLSPEGFAAILWKDRSRSPEACELMKLTAEDLKELGVVEEVISEGRGGVQVPENRDAVFGQLDESIASRLHDLMALEPKGLVNHRYERFRNMGTFNE